MGTEEMSIPSRRIVSAVLFDLDNTLADRDQAFLTWAGWFAPAWCARRTSHA